MSGLTRRRFLTAAGAAALAAPAWSAKSRARVIGANERIRIGQVGCGGRGLGAHMTGIKPYFKECNFEVVAVADPWRIAREKAAASAKEWFGTEPKMFVSYRDLLAVKDLDAVMVASPDHHHTTHLEAVAKAGKHVYIEKPMAQDIDALNRAVDAVKAAGIIAQVGTQIRSLPEIGGCRELYKSGIFGKVTRIEECRNNEKPYWYQYLKDAKKEDVDWPEFLGDIKSKPFRADYYSGWYGYYDTSRGPIPGYGAHYIDMVNYITGSTYPTECVCLGGTLMERDEHQFTAPDSVQALWLYPEGFLVSSSNNLSNSDGSVRKIYGDAGVLDFSNWSAPFYNAKGAPKRATGKIRGEKKVEPIARPDHFRNWLDCLRSGKQPHAPIEAGHQHAVAVIMAMMSYESGRKAIYDREKRAIKFA